MNVLIACEFSGIVRNAFIERGHDAVSCDLIPSEQSGPHIIGNVLEYLNDDWDLMIAHPPCTYLTRAGAWMWQDHQKEQKDAIKFFHDLAYCNIKKRCVENPAGILSTIYRKPDQYIHPYQFGHGMCKMTGLWLYNLPLLTPTKLVSGRSHKLQNLGESKGRSKARSRTFKGIARAMAEQWG